VSPSERVRALLEPVVDAAGLVLEDVTVTPAGKRRVLRVVVDLPEEVTGALDLDAVAEVSRVVSEALDASDVLGGSPYVLEVTSPGVDRPLTQRRHWARAHGRLVVAQVETDDGAGQVSGRVLAVDDEGVRLQTEDDERVLTWPTLRRGHVQVEFNRPGAGDDEED
jgi:ribosome maturation factor RimP